MILTSYDTWDDPPSTVSTLEETCLTAGSTQFLGSQRCGVTTLDGGAAPLGGRGGLAGRTWVSGTFKPVDTWIPLGKLKNRYPKYIKMIKNDGFFKMVSPLKYGNLGYPCWNFRGLGSDHRGKITSSWLRDIC